MIIAAIQEIPDFQAMARQTATLIMPEIILAFFACAALVLEVMLPRGRKVLVAWISLVGVLISAGSVALLFTAVSSGETPSTGFYGMIVVDNYALAFQVIFLVGAALSILLSMKYLEIERALRGEYYALMLLSVVGMMFLSCSVDLLTLFVSLELMAIPLYVLVGFFRKDRKSNEAAIKYFLLGAFSSGILLYGISLLYGITGSTNLSSVAGAIPKVASATFELAGGRGDLRYLLLLALTLIGAGMFFKVAAVPFHMWAPDAYEGAPTSVTAFMSVAVKAASFAMFGRLFLYGLPDLRTAIGGDLASNIPALPGWSALLGIVAALTIVVGNLAALSQSNIKRLLAYSSISHAGYTLLGLVAGNKTGYTGFILYLFIYTLMNLGVFGCIIALRRQNIIGEQMEDLNGLSRKAPVLTVLMTIFLLSLGGIPPTAGFIGKFYLFAGLIETGNPWLVRLAVLAVIMTVVSLYYYMRFIRAMFIASEAELQPVRLSPALKTALGIAAAVVLAAGIYAGPFINAAQRAASSDGIMPYVAKPAAPAVPPKGGVQRVPMPPGSSPGVTK